MVAHSLFSYVQVVLNCSALPCLLHLLSSAKESIRKEACWTISNITAGNRAQIQVMRTPNTCDHEILKCLICRSFRGRQHLQQMEH